MNKRLEQLVNIMERPVDNRVIDAILNWVPIVSTIRLNKKNALNCVDDITGLPNKGHLFRKLREAVENYWEKGEYFALIHCDPAGLKYANDFASWSEGSKLIQTAAGVIRNIQLSRRDAIARYGGDENLILIAGRKMAVMRKVGQIIDHVRESQDYKNSRPEAERRRFMPVVEGQVMNLCIGYGVVTADYLRKNNLIPRQIKTNTVFKYVDSLADIGHRLSKVSKGRQGIYVQFPKYDSNGSAAHHK